MIEAYPLQWPLGYPRNQHPERNANFKQPDFGRVRDAVIRELQLLNAGDIVISSNIPVKRDGMPYADFLRRVIHDKGIAVYFMLDNQQRVLCCDAWDRLEDNMHAIKLTIEAIRGMDRWQVSQILDRVFSGFKELPESTATAKNIWSTLGLTSKPSNVEAVHTAYKTLAKKLHPDMGGSAAAFAELAEAYRLAKTFYS